MMTGQKSMKSNIEPMLAEYSNAKSPGIIMSGACYTKGMRKKEISIFTTVMEKHMEKNRRSSRRYAD